MDVSDPILLKIVSSHPQLSEKEYYVLESWWLSDRVHGENVVDFLIRQGVFTRDSVKTIDLLRKGMLTYWDPKRIFGDQGHLRLRDYAQQGGYNDPKSDPNRVLQPESRGRPVAGPTSSTHSKLNDVRDWLARRAEAKQAASIPTPLDIDIPPPPQPSVQAPPSPNFSHSQPVDPLITTPAPTAKTMAQGYEQTEHVIEGKPFPEVGQQYGRYLLSQKVAQSSTTVVFRANAAPENKTVLLKVMRIDKEEGLSDFQTKMLDSLRNDVQKLVPFEHPNLVQIIELDENAPFPFVTVECVDGMNLFDVLAHVGSLKPDRAIRILLEVCEALSAAHSNLGLIHGDVKPGYILLARDGSVKLAELGLAMTTDAMSVASDVNSSILAGTAACMAPEACTSGQVDLRTDIYSLGATLYHAVVGEMPFKAKNRMDMMLMHTHDNPVPPHQVVPELDERVSKVILKMMAKKPQDRYQTYEELTTDLSQLQSTRIPQQHDPVPA